MTFYKVTFEVGVPADNSTAATNRAIAVVANDPLFFFAGVEIAAGHSAPIAAEDPTQNAVRIVNAAVRLAKDFRDDDNSKLKAISMWSLTDLPIQHMKASWKS